MVIRYPLEKPIPISFLKDLEDEKCADQRRRKFSIGRKGVSNELK